MKVTENQVSIVKVSWNWIFRVISEILYYDVTNRRIHFSRMTQFPLFHNSSLLQCYIISSEILECMLCSPTTLCHINGREISSWSKTTVSIVVMLIRLRVHAWNFWLGFPAAHNCLVSKTLLAKRYTESYMF